MWDGHRLWSPVFWLWLKGLEWRHRRSLKSYSVLVSDVFLLTKFLSSLIKTRQNDIKTTFRKGITWNLVHTFFRDYSSTLFHFYFENYDVCGDFCAKIKKNVEKTQNFQNFKILKIIDGNFVAHSFPSRIIFSACLYLYKWACNIYSRKPLFT